MKSRFLLKYPITVLIFLGIVLVFFPFKARAALSSDISIDVVPENPSPNESTTVTLSSYAYNLDTVLISWEINGKKDLSGTGQKSLSVNAPALGEQTVVTATISLPDGNLKETVTIKPSIVAMLWQANDSYVPPFYEGKAMPSPDSDIKVVAMPEIKNGSSFVDPSNMTYDWQLDYTNSPGGSGYDKNYFIYTNNYLDNSNNVEVTASTLDQNDSVDGSVNIATISPKIDFYRKDPSIGTIWEQALSDGYKIDNSDIIQAAPYFISPKNIEVPILTFNWSIDDEPVSVPEGISNLLPLKTATGTSGTSDIKLEIDNSLDITEGATKDINVQF